MSSLTKKLVSWNAFASGTKSMIFVLLALLKKSTGNGDTAMSAASKTFFQTAT